jgi:hypothetical protein
MRLFKKKKFVRIRIPRREGYPGYLKCSYPEHLKNPGHHDSDNK